MNADKIWRLIVMCGIPLLLPAQVKFDVVSVKACKDSVSGKPGERGGGSRSTLSPGRLRIECMTVAELIDIAYAQYGERPLLNDAGIPGDTRRVRGLPGWAESDRYTIDAKSADPAALGSTQSRSSASTKIMRGPMVRAVLEERFGVRVRSARKPGIEARAGAGAEGSDCGGSGRAAVGKLGPCGNRRPHATNAFCLVIKPRQKGKSGVGRPF